MYPLRKCTIVHVIKEVFQDSGILTPQLPN